MSPVGITHWLNAKIQIISDQVRHGASDQGDQNGIETSGWASGSRATRETWFSGGRDPVLIVGVASFSIPPCSKEDCSRRNFSWFSSRTGCYRFFTMGILNWIKSLIIEERCPLFLQLFRLEHLRLPLKCLNSLN